MASYDKEPNFFDHEKICEDFILNFTNKKRSKKYVKMMQDVSDRKRKTFDINMDDIILYDKTEKISKYIIKNTLRYINIFGKIIDKNLPKANKNAKIIEDVYDCLYESRLKMLSETIDDASLKDKNFNIPNELLRRYQVRILPSNNLKAIKIRDISSNNIGGLIYLKGIVIKITDVKPMIKIATYICDECGNEIYQKINKKSYIPLSICISAKCQERRNKKPIIPQARGSRFIKFQEIKLQELPDEVPDGNVPRSITVYIFGENTRLCQCGDKIFIYGIWLPIPAFGYQLYRIGGSLTSNTYLHSMNIIKEKKDYKINKEIIIDKRIDKKLLKLSKDNNIYDRLSQSIAPEIFGLDDVKKCILLLLVSGNTNKEEDGMKIRGDINILLMGDPGVAKSQLLKHIVHVAPRCVYTTGKGSSGVGLTASVVRDNITKDMTLEGGALVLSDMGICCIDEFDKMDESDRTAIHEVMEQQTISIAKAGITTTLNARVSILAAANPAFGRYDKRRTPEQNINLPAALLSRFDLVFVLCDIPNEDNDLALARHITHVHQYLEHPKLQFKPINNELLMGYIAKAKTFNPTIPINLTEYITNCYVKMRKNCLDINGNYDSRKIIGTPRALLSILRISQALAKLRFSNTVAKGDVTEAMRLIKEAKNSTLNDDDIKKDLQDITSNIFNIIKNYLIKNNDFAKIEELKSMLITQGFNDNEINDTLNIYADDDVWMISTDGETLSLI